MRAGLLGIEELDRAEIEAILARDLYVVIGGVLLSMIFLVAGNLLADLLLYWADPRIRTAASAK